MLASDVASNHRYLRMESEPPSKPPHPSPPPAQVPAPEGEEPDGRAQEFRVFDELPTASIVSVSRPDAGDITPMQLSYIIEFHYKQFRWTLVKKASQVLYVHFALKKRAFIEELHEKQEQVKEWLHHLGVVDTAVVHDDDEGDDLSMPSHLDEAAVRNRNVPSAAALPVIRPALGRQHSISDRAKIAMQEYLNHFFGNLDIVNSREVCRFLEVSRISFLPEYGPKLKEDYLTVRHLPKFSDEDSRSCPCNLFNCCKSRWQKVWAVLKPGFLALLKDPFDVKLLDILVFDLLPQSDGNGNCRGPLAKESKERNPLQFGFQVSCSSRTVKLRSRSYAKVKEWVAAINDAALRAPEGWCHPHRFGSFAPPRGLTEDGSMAQWFIDGQAAFQAIASTIEEAKSEIFITDWWLCPELYLRRPFVDHESSRLESLLEARAKQGVQIYVLLYKEVALALKINSLYSKRRLLNIHENVKVLRYPDHFSTGIYLWSHHEKIVVVDHQVCFIGGLDLCFGRYDTPEHKVADFPSQIWPGKDYYNPRESEPNSWEDTMKDELDRSKYPRMPWHDVQCALWGPPCRDVARHFVQRWNFAKRNKAPHEQAIPLLMPQNHMVIPHYLGTNKETGGNVEKEEDGASKESEFKKLVPSTRSSCQDIPLLEPQEHNHGLLDDENVVPDLDIARLLDDSRSNKWNKKLPLRKSKHEHAVQDLPMKDFVDDYGSPHQRKTAYFETLQPNTQMMDREWWEAQEREIHAPLLDIGQVGPLVPCHCQVLRSVGQWSAGTSQTEGSIHNAYISVIEKSEHFVYLENQFFISGLSGDETIKNRILEALYRRIIKAHKENKCFRVIIVIPLLPGFQGGIDDAGAASVRAIMHWQYRTICRGPNSILQKLQDSMGPRAHDYISFYGLRSYGRLCNEGPLVTSQIYVHSKLMIVDDRIVLLGSANINDRSLIGSRDSEIDVLIEDREFLISKMNGRPWRAGKFSLSLRLSLWAEHLGIRQGEANQILDPVEDATYEDIWVATAKSNTAIFQDVFSCVPNDLIHSRSQLRQSASQLKDKMGHNTIDLGVAPEALEAPENGDGKSTDPVERLQAVKGHIVSFPLDFMSQEDLRPFFGESEFYTSPHVFH